MGNIVIFEKITTNDVLLELDAESKKYEGLHVDMNNKDERKFVKDKASLVSGMLKKLDRARIDESKEYKIKVEKEALDIKERLEIINLPFTALIDAHKAERAEILAEEKRIEAAKELAIQIELDHENGIMENKVRDFEIQQEITRQKELKEQQRLESIAESERLAKEAADKAKEKAAQDLIDAENRRVADVERAKQDEINRQNAIAAKQKADEEARIANQAHVTSVCSDAKNSLMLSTGLTEDQAIAVIKAIRSNAVINVSIKF